MRQGRCRELGHGVEQVGQEFLALVRNDDDGELVDGAGRVEGMGQYILSRAAGECCAEAIEYVLGTVLL